MPSVSYDNTAPKTFVSSSLPKFKFASPNINLKGIFKSLLVLLVTIIASFLSAVLAGVVMAIGGNVTVANLDIIFDPQITIAYILTFYFISHFYDLNRRQMYNLFILSIFLSFTINYIQGSILLILLPPMLRKLRLISPATPSSP